jgi:hypothetical protein
MTNQILRSQPKAVGGGSSAGGTFMTSMGNFAFDMGTAIVANKLTQGIKNPYLKAFANFGIAQGANTFLKPLIFGTGTAAGGAAAASTPALFTAGNAADIGGAFMSSAPGIGVSGSIGASLTRAGYTTAGDFMTGVQVGMNNFTGASATATGQMVAETAGTSWAAAAGELAGEVLPYTAAIIKALQGDFVGAATTAAGTYAGAQIGFALGGPVGAAIGSVIGSIAGSWLGSLFGGGRSSPAYKSIQRVVRVGGNNDPTQRVTTSTGNNPPVEFTQFCDSLLTGAFNAAKFIERYSGVTFPFDYIGIYVHQKHGVFLRLFKQGDGLDAGGRKELNLGGVSNFNVSKAMVAIADFFKTVVSEGKEAADLKKIETASKLVKSKGANALTKDMLRELSPGGKYALDQTKNAGMYHESATMSKEIEDYYNGLQAHPVQGLGTTDYDGNVTGVGPRMIWSFKDNKYVEAPSTEVTEYNSDSYLPYTVKRYDENIIGIDKNGNAIYNYEDGKKSALSRTEGGITISDLQKHATSVYPNYVEPVSSGTTTPTVIKPYVDTEVKGGPLDKKSTVAVVGSNNTTNDNSTKVTNVNNVSATSDPWRTNTTNTGMPLVA